MVERLSAGAVLAIPSTPPTEKCTTLSTSAAGVAVTFLRRQPFGVSNTIADDSHCGLLAFGVIAAGVAAHRKRSERRCAQVVRTFAQKGLALPASEPTRAALLRGSSSAAIGSWLGAYALSASPAFAVSASANALPDLKGKFALVTGASKGIGKGIAIGLAELGSTVFITGRDAARLATTAELANQAGGQGIPLLCDHADDKQVAAAFDEVSKRTGGRLDILVNNAFKGPSESGELNSGAKFYEQPLSLWDDVQRVGLRSHYVASYYAAPMLLESARREVAAGSSWRPFLCMTSSFGGVSYLFATAYGVGKAATDRLARDLQVELGPQGVDCLSVWPGVVLTEKIEELIRTDSKLVANITGGQDPGRVTESPLLSGRVVARLAIDPSLRDPKGGVVQPDGLLGRHRRRAETAGSASLPKPPRALASKMAAHLAASLAIFMVERDRQRHRSDPWVSWARVRCAPRFQKGSSGWPTQVAR